jgi:hypothetical protein
MTTTTPTVDDAIEVLAVEIRLAVTILLTPLAFDFTVAALLTRLGPIGFALAVWTHPATRLINRLDLRQRGARP